KKELKKTSNLVKPTSTVVTTLAKRRAKTTKITGLEDADPVKTTKITGLEDADPVKTTNSTNLPSRLLRRIVSIGNKLTTSKALNPEKKVIGVVKTQVLAVASPKSININKNSSLKYTTPTSKTAVNYIAKIPQIQYPTRIQKQYIGEPYQEYANIITTKTLSTTRTDGVVKGINPDQIILKSDTKIKRESVTSRKSNLQENILPRPIKIQPFRTIINTSSILPLVSISSNPGTKTSNLNTIISKSTVTGTESKRYLERMVGDNKKIKEVYSTPTTVTISTQKQRMKSSGIPKSTSYENTYSTTPIAINNRMVDENRPHATNGTIAKSPRSEINESVIKSNKNNLCKIKESFHKCKCKTSGFFTMVFTRVHDFFKKITQVVGNFARSVGHKVKSIGDYVGKKLFSKDGKAKDIRMASAQTTFASVTSTKTSYLTLNKKARAHNNRIAASFTVSSGSVVKVKIPPSLTTKVVKKGIRFVTIVLEV
ncbi:hypothetical protein AYI69_g9661, partial [Smittium culicis]